MRFRVNVFQIIMVGVMSIRLNWSSESLSFCSEFRFRLSVACDTLFDGFHVVPGLGEVVLVSQSSLSVSTRTSVLFNSIFRFRLKFQFPCNARQVDSLTQTGCNHAAYMALTSLRFPVSSFKIRLRIHIAICMPLSYLNGFFHFCTVALLMCKGDSENFLSGIHQVNLEPTRGFID